MLRRPQTTLPARPGSRPTAGYWFKDVSQPEEPAAEASPSAEPAEPEPTPLCEAESYASANPEGAARIRAAGGVPADIDFAPPKPHIVTALVNGTSPILCALDHIARKATVPA